MLPQYPMDYKKSGVDIEKGDEFVEWIKSTQPENQPHQERIVDGLGGFAGVFNGHFPHMEEPCFVAATDGIGTKLLLGEMYENYEGLGQDLVAMCVNDLICVGAQPLFFLDYFACGKLDLKKAKSFVTGVRNACIESGAFLLGGETAEMPGLYQPHQFDGAGFAVGVVDKKNIWGKHKVKEGDVIIGVESSGFHSNGYSLLRKVFEKDMDQWQEELLIPTFLYPKMTAAFTKNKIDIKACANITGGGMSNIPRCLSKDLQARLKKWPLSKACLEVLERTGMSEKDLYQTLNCGLGFVVIVDEKEKQKLQSVIEAQGFKNWQVGQVVKKSSIKDPDWEFESD